MLLLIEVGNTQTVLAICDTTEARFDRIWRVDTVKDLDASGWQTLISSRATNECPGISMISAIAISSVVPIVTESLLSLFGNWLDATPTVVSSNLKLGIELAVEFPDQVGADRLCNATAAFELAHGAAVVVDVGTATKFEAISGDGVFLGGAIAPGIGVSLEALVGKAAKLDAVPLDFPPNPIGVNTVEAMQSGLVLGHLAMIEGMVDRFRQVVGVDAPSIITGGYGSLFLTKSTVFDHFEPELTLRGLFRIWKLNQ